MHFIRLPNGNIVVPVPFEVNGIMGERMVELSPTDDAYREWEAFFGSEWEVILDVNDWRAPRARAAIPTAS